MQMYSSSSASVQNCVRKLLAGSTFTEVEPGCSNVWWHWSMFLPAADPQSYWLVSVELYRILWGWRCLYDCAYVSVWAVQVFSIPRSQAVLKKVCQNVWREPVLTDSVQVFFPDMHLFFYTTILWKMQKWVEKAPSTHVHTYVLSRLIYEMGGYTCLLCAHGQMTLCDLLYMGLYLFPCNTSCLFWLIWETMQHIFSSAQRKAAKPYKKEVLDIFLKYFDESTRACIFFNSLKSFPVIFGNMKPSISQPKKK